MIYINYVSNYGRDTVAMYKTRKEARDDLKEYRQSTCGGNYYLSTRACKHWYDDMKSTEEAKKQLKTD